MGPFGGCVECGPPGAQHHAAGGAVPLGCQLLFSEDPEEQLEQQPLLSIQVPGSVPALFRYVVLHTKADSFPSAERIVLLTSCGLSCLSHRVWCNGLNMTKIVSTENTTRLINFHFYYAAVTFLEKKGYHHVYRYNLT